jgi:light-regulated signal transduction histidine kinase (bacteriophytochrome)
VNRRLGEFIDQYSSALERYLATREESGLQRAYELGRKHVANGVGVLEIAAVHHEVVARLLRRAPTPEEGEQIMTAASSFFAECLSPFEMVLRGFQEANVTLGQLNETLKQRAAELEAVNKELDAFSYSVSHDLRAPVRHISGYAELLQKYLSSSSRLDEKTQRYLNILSESAKQMGALIDDLLAFSRIGRADLHKASVNLEQLVKEVIHDFDQEIEGRDIIWKINILPQVQADRALLRVVIVNLISNALKFTRPRAQALIEIASRIDRDDEITFFVRDNGVGFDMKYADKLFSVFQRLHGEDQFEGTGIGLATVARIIERHGGRVWAEGTQNQGATFYFSIPRP